MTKPSVTQIKEAKESTLVAVLSMHYGRISYKLFVENIAADISKKEKIRGEDCFEIIDLFILRKIGVGFPPSSILEPSYLFSVVKQYFPEFKVSDNYNGFRPYEEYFVSMTDTPERRSAALSHNMKIHEVSRSFLLHVYAEEVLAESKSTVEAREILFGHLVREFGVSPQMASLLSYERIADILGVPFEEWVGKNFGIFEKARKRLLEEGLESV